MPIGSQVIYNAGDLILSTVSSSGNTFVETKIAAATSSVILFNNSASLTSASLNSLTVGNAISSSYALTASFALNAGGGSGTVSGSTNYIAKFISSTSVGTSSIYESGSNVGIGTIDPQYKLDVRPAGANARIGIAELGAWPASSTFAYFQHSLLNNLDGGNYALVQSSAGETFLNAAQGQVLHFRINNGEVGQFNSSGYLGIGHNNNPITAKLEVSGSPGEYLFNVKSTSTPYTLFASGSGRVGIGTNVLPNKLTIDGNVTASSYTSSILNAVGFLGTASYALTASAVSIVPANVFVQGGNSFGATALLGTNDAQSLALETNGTTRMSINSNGNVAINTSTSGFYRLNIADTHRGSLGSASLYIETIQNQNQGLATSANDSGIQNVYFVNNFTSSTAIQNQAIFNQLYINGSGSFSGSYRASRNAITISNTASLDSGGNITNTYLTNQISPNIPTFSIPNWIAGTGTFIDIITGNSTGSITNLYNHQIGSPFPSGGAGGITVTNSYGVYINKQKTTNIVTNGWGIYQADTGDLNIFAGKTRIGSTTTPVNTLDVTGNISASVVTASLFGTASWANNASTASYVSPSGNAFIQGGNSFGTTATLGTNDASALIFETNGTGRVTIDTNGYVGIAQPTPTAYLHVGQNTASDTNNYGIRIDKNGTLGSPGTYQNSAIYLSDLAGDGPSTVDVVGQVSLNFPRLQASDLSSSKVSHLIIAHDSALGPMRVDGKGNLWVGYDRNTANTSSNSFSTLIYGGLTVGSGYQTTTVSDGTAIFSGNVGIGTSNPQFLLDVSGSSRHGVISTNVHQFTGSVNINGSLFSNANITASNISASRTGSFSIVGVGTTSPAAKLAVGSNPTYAAGVTLIVGTPGNPSTSGTAQPYANLRLGTNTGNSQVLDFGIYDASPYGSWIQAAGGGNLAFPSPLVLNPTGGSLGIGTSNPVATLDIENAVANIPVLNLGGGIGGENVSDLYVLNSYNANTGVGYSAKVIGVNISGSLTAQNIPVQRTVWSGVTSATAIVLGADGPRQGTQDNAFQIWTTSEGTSGSLLTQKFSLTSTGDVGIGTTSPGSKLTVSGSIESLTDNGGEGGQLILRGNTYRYNIDNFNGQALRFFREDDITTANGQVLMYLSSSGNVGIGNTDPSFLIDVSGNSRHGAISTNAHQFTGSVSLSDGLSLTNLTASNISASGNIIASRITSSNVLINGNLTVTGSIFASLFSASYIYITSSTLVVTDNIITLNALSPYQRYAGMEMYDSGSGNLSSFLWDGQGDYFFVTGSGVNSKIIVGPDQQTNLTSGRLTKATGTNIIGDSIVTDNGSGIIVSGYISGSSVITGNITASNISASGTGTFNNVGIGTSTLRNQLTVIGPAQNTSAISDGGNTGGTIFIGSSLNQVNQGGTLLFSTINDLGTYLPQWGIKTLFTNGTGNGVSDLAFSTRTTGSATSLTEQVRFTSNGRVGIGTNSPATTLNVSGSTRISAGELQIEGDNATIRLYRTTGINYFDWASGQNFYLGTVTSLGGAGRSNKMVILDSGNVGIGTTVPGSKLQINDSTPTLTLRADDGGVSRKAYIDFYTTFFNYPSDTNARRTSTISTGFADGTYGTWGTEFMAFHVGSGSANDAALLPIERMRIDGSGNVGIGVTSPSGRLHVTASATNGQSLVYLSKGSGSITQYYINAVNQLGQLNYRVSSDINGHASQTLYYAGTAYVYHDSYWSSWINNNNYTQGGLNLGSSGLTHGYGLTIARPATSGSLYVSGSSVFTGSVGISGSINLSGPIIYDNAVLMDFGRTTTPAISTNYVVLQNITGSYNSAFFDYFASSASNFRAGTVIAGWSGSSINYTEYATTDIGNTNQLTMSVDLSSSYIRLLTTVSTTTNWNIKSSGRYL